MADVHGYMQVMESMTPEEKKALLDSVAQYDSATKNKILKIALDSKAKTLGISQTTVPWKSIDAWLDKMSINNNVEIEKANPGMTVDANWNMVPKVNKVTTLFKPKPKVAVVDVTKPAPLQSDTPMMSTPTGEVKWYIWAKNTTPNIIPTYWATIDNKITNNLVDQWKLPESQRENIPQNTVANKWWFNRLPGGWFSISPYTPEQLAKVEADDLAMRNKAKSILPKQYTPEQLAKVEADDLAMRKKVGWFFGKLFKPYNFTEQVKK